VSKPPLLAITQGGESSKTAKPPSKAYPQGKRGRSLMPTVPVPGVKESKQRANS